MKVGLLMSRLRVEEKWLMAALEARGIGYDRIDDGEAVFDLDAGPGTWAQYDVVLERSISYVRGLYAAQMLNAWGIPTVNIGQRGCNLRRQAGHFGGAEAGRRASAASARGLYDARPR